MVVEQDTFEDLYGRLEAAVQRLEVGGLPLDELIQQFEQGMRLAKRCRDLLEGAELRVTTLVEEFQPAGVGSPGGTDPS
jgi:exodeoxyribonuclease VII small subunit